MSDWLSLLLRVLIEGLPWIVVALCIAGEAFFAAAHWTLLVTSLYLFVEAGACCGWERRARFRTWGRHDARAGSKPKSGDEGEKNRDEEAGATRARDDRDERDDEKKRGKAINI